MFQPAELGRMFQPAELERLFQPAELGKVSLALNSFRKVLQYIYPPSPPLLVKYVDEKAIYIESDFLKINLSF